MRMVGNWAEDMFMAADKGVHNAAGESSGGPVLPIVESCQWPEGTVWGCICGREQAYKARIKELEELVLSMKAFIDLHAAADTL
jgi:hypothetical protein